MSGTTNFKQFDQTQTNMATDVVYDASAQQSNGFTSGICPSLIMNKALYQVSTFVTAFATVLASVLGGAVNDTSITALEAVLANILTTVGGTLQAGTTFVLGRDPIAPLEAATKHYVDSAAGGAFLPLAGITPMTGVLNHALGASIAAASTINLTTATGNLVHITGTNQITEVTLGAGMWRNVIFDGTLTLTHNSVNNNLPGGVNITTQHGDRAVYFSDGTTVYCANYTPASGVVSAHGFQVFTASGTFTAQSTSVLVSGLGAGGAPGSSIEGSYVSGDFSSVIAANGNPGSATTFGSYVAIPGGSGGPGGNTESPLTPTAYPWLPIGGTTYGLPGAPNLTGGLNGAAGQNGAAVLMQPVTGLTIGQEITVTIGQGGTTVVNAAGVIAGSPGENGILIIQW